MEVRTFSSNLQGWQIIHVLFLRFLQFYLQAQALSFSQPLDGTIPDWLEAGDLANQHR
jgi:hypothetical protein